ncbi:replisome organizer [Enterocloster clostridioformis]|uniref:DUF6674 family protein n=1 Tax=Enterocloster clostridioformis TaxID=1531 RepID=UPI0026760567|nr:DUF6674 family protein [Enterocloster clostridioformis]
MANRRMFSLDVVDTDKFLDMPAASQNLYFHLGMRADDDGFVSSPKKITKLVNCGCDDLNVLISRGFVIALDDGIMVITHWKQNNYIQADRYKRTVYQEQLSQLTVNNGVYELDTGRIQTLLELLEQHGMEQEKEDVVRMADYIDSMEAQLGTVLKELGEVKNQLGVMQESKVKTFAVHALQKVEEQVKTLRSQVGELKTKFVDRA